MVYDSSPMEMNEPRNTASDNSGIDIPEMTPEERKACKLVDTIFNNERKKRSGHDVKWADYYRMFRGDQWRKQRPKYLHQEVFNFIFQTIQSMVPIIMDARPKVAFTPREPTDLEFTEYLNMAYESDYQANRWLTEETAVLYNSHIYGTGFSSLKFDPSLELGLGRIVYSCEDTFTCYPDYETSEVNKYDARYFVHAEPEDVEKVKIRYAGHKYFNAIKPDLVFLQNKSQSDYSNVHRVRNYDKDLPRETYGYSNENEKDKCLVITLYMKPEDTEEMVEETKTPDGEIRQEYVTKKKYPRGRKLVKINGYIFEDTELPNDDLKFPYSKMVNYIDPGSQYGISEIEPLEHPQQIFNKLISFVLDVLTFTGNPVWLLPTTSGVNPGSFHNAPGMQIPYDGDNPPRRMEGAQLQPYVMQIIDRVENWFNSLSGATEVTRGITPPQVTAASAIENLRDAAQTRLRQKSRNMDDYLTDVGEQYVNLLLQNYTTPRMFRLTNDKNVNKYFKMSIQPAVDEAGNPLLSPDGTQVKQAVVVNYEEDDIGVRETIPKTFLIRGSFDVKVNTASGLPFSKAEKEQRLIQLFDRQIIDREEFLKSIDYPNYEAVLERIKQREAEMAEQQAMQGAQ